MADFTPEHPFWSNFQISITSEMYGVEGWNFQGLIISTLSTNSKKMNKIWEVRVSTSNILDDLTWNYFKISDKNRACEVFKTLFRHSLDVLRDFST